MSLRTTDESNKRGRGVSSATSNAKRHKGGGLLPDQVGNDTVRSCNLDVGKGGKSKSGSPDFLTVDPANPAEFLKREGYVYLSKRVPESLCSKLRKLVHKDMERLMKLSSHQEQPSELLSAPTNKVMAEVKNYLISHVLKPCIGGITKVPQTWGETMYGRLKKYNAYTKPHCDALNTIIERRLLCEVEGLPHPASLINWAGERPLDQVFCIAGEFAIERLLPIYTVWVPLHSLDSFKFSHLRVQPKSHLATDIQVTEHKRTKRVLSVGSKTFKKPFLCPQTPYQVGDVVIFHCLTQHDGTCHKRKSEGIQNCRAQATSELTSRVSFDMRVFMDGF